MKLLFENWRKYLTEEESGMKTVENLEKEDIYILARRSGLTEIGVEFVYAGVDRHGTPYALNYSDAVSGEVEIAPSGYEEVDGPCDNAWQVKYTSAVDKWGPLLYDVAIEYATMHGNGLISDREEVSPQARRVWDYYLDRRADVGNHQLDDMEDTLTPDIEVDNCSQEIASPGFLAATADNWVDSALSKRYTKKSTTISKLLKLKGRTGLPRFIDQT